MLAERREQPGPQVKLQDAMNGLFFAGQPLATRTPIGTVETLNAATGASIKAFHDRCWRDLADGGFPDRIAGWEPTLKTLIPTYGQTLNGDADTAAKVVAKTASVLHINA